MNRYKKYNIRKTCQISLIFMLYAGLTKLYFNTLYKF